MADAAERWRSSWKPAPALPPLPSAPQRDLAGTSWLRDAPARPPPPVHSPSAPLLRPTPPPAPPHAPAWGGARAPPPAGTAPPTQLRAIVAQEERAAAPPQRRLPVPPLPAPALPVRVLRPGQPVSWAEMACSAPKPEPAASRTALEARSRADGRVRCLVCGLALEAPAALEAHVKAAHGGVKSVAGESQGPLRRDSHKSRRAPLLLGDLLESASRQAHASSANALLLHVRDAKARRDAGGPALGFQARPKAGGERMANPNTASSAAVITRRGKERVGGRKKRLSSLKKVILRERAAKAAALVAAAGQEVESARCSDSDGEVVVHVARERVYVSLDASELPVRLCTLVVEAAGDSDGEESSDEEEEEADAEADAPPPAAAALTCPSAPALALRASAAPFVPHAPPGDDGAPEFSSPEGWSLRCQLCGVECAGAVSYAQHLEGRRHVARVRAAAASTSAATAPPAAAAAAPPACPPQTYLGASAELRYGRQVLTPQLNAACAALLQRLMELQARLRACDPLKAKARQRLVFGLREAAKALRTRRARALIVAPNVEAVAAPGGLDDALASLLAAAAASGVPVVLALTRARMGALTGRPVRMSACAVLDASGCEEAFKEVLRLTEEGRREWRGAHPLAEPEAQPCATEAEAFVRLRRDGRHRALRAGEAPGLPERQ